MPSPTSTVAQQARNVGASINLISGIQGIAPGGSSTINMPVNARIHRLNFQCTGIFYGYAGTPVATPTVAGTETFTVTVTNGAISGIAINNAVTAKAAGTYLGTIVDVNYTALNGNVIKIGQGATFSYVVNGALAVTSVTLTSPGTVSAIPPELFFTQQQHKVNGSVVRDISAALTVKLSRANGFTPEDGEMDVFFTEPWRRIVDHDQATAWDLIGQSTYQIIFGIRSGITSPALGGVYEFDFLRNARRVPGQAEPELYLRPIAQHEFTFNAPQGDYNVTNLPVDYPIQRIWMSETGPGSISYVQLKQDGNMIVEGTNGQINQMIRQYDFVKNIFDFPCIFDMDQRLGKALRVNNLIVKVTSAAPALLSCLVEIQQDTYS